MPRNFFQKESKLMSWGHLHLLLNHVPVIGTLLGLLLLLVAFGRKNEELKKVTLGLFVLIALVTVPVYLTGEPAEEMVENIPGVSEAMIEQHENAALFSLIAVEVGGIIALAGLLLFGRKKGLGNLLAIVTLSFLSGYWRPHAGGPPTWEGRFDIQKSVPALVPNHNLRQKRAVALERTQKKNARNIST